MDYIRSDSTQRSRKEPKYIETMTDIVDPATILVNNGILHPSLSKDLFKCILIFFFFFSIDVVGIQNC